MQLILESETSADLKTKMSLNEENVDNSASGVVTVVQNGSNAIGDEGIIEKCLPDNVTGVKNEANGECIANGEVTNDSDDAVDSEKNNIVEKIQEIEESKTYIDNVLEQDSETTHVNNNVQLNDLQANINLCEHIDIKEEIEDTIFTGDEKTEISEDIDIKTEIYELNSNENNTELDTISQLPDHPELLETNDNDTHKIMIKTETTENTPAPEEKETMETENTEINTNDENIDLIRLDAEFDNGDALSESLNHETEKKGLSTVDPKVEDSSKADEVTEMDIDTSVDHIDEKVVNENTSVDHIDEKHVNENTSVDRIDEKDVNEEIASTIPTVNTTEITESNDCDLNETDSTEKDKQSQPSAVSSHNNIDNLDDDVENDKPSQPSPVTSHNNIDNLDDDIEKSNDSIINVETNSNVTMVEDDKPVINCDDDTEVTKNVEPNDHMSIDGIIDLDKAVSKESQDSKSVENNIQNDDTNKTFSQDAKNIEPILKLSNTLDILSDDEEEQIPKSSTTDHKCINIEDDDDIMLIDDDTSGNESKLDPVKEHNIEEQMEAKPESPSESVKITEYVKSTDTADNVPETDATVPDTEVTETIAAPDISEKKEENRLETEMKKPLISENFLKTCKKNVGEMTRDELEELCILKIVESILDRSNLSEIKNKLKTLTQNLEEYKKKTMMLSKQNRDLQVVFKSVQEDVKKCHEAPIVPLKITRSVGMQVLMTDKPVDKRKRTGIGMPTVNKQVRTPVTQAPRSQKPPTQQIPVPRLVPANSPVTKSPQQQVNTAKTTSPLPNGVKSVSPVQKGEKRTHNRVQSVTVDLTDDEPPAKVVNRTQGPVPPVRLVPSQNLLAPPRPNAVNSPRKVYIPISGPQGQNIRPGQTIMLKSVPSASPRQRVPPPHMVRMPQTLRVPRPQIVRHPAPLPECMKQYQPPNWKALPPAPDLKLAKVENGIVVSWKIEGYQEDSYEEIASYQLYAYQETSSQPSTALWKKIGDVKALPLPMACTLTQFMAGYKYYFAVRAVDIRSRLGPFSLPGSILLLNKM